MKHGSGSVKSLKIRDGDISLSLGRRAQFVTGKEKLVQDLTLWLLEPLGTGTTTPRFGTILEEMIGVDDPREQEARVHAEITRVLSLYQSWQIKRLKDATLRNALSSWSRAEILQEIVSVETEVIGSRLVVRVKLNTLAGSKLDVSLFLDTFGADVSVS